MTTVKYHCPVCGRYGLREDIKNGYQLVCPTDRLTWIPEQSPIGMKVHVVLVYQTHEGYIKAKTQGMSEMLACEIEQLRCVTHD
jgi:hypothetical protein